MKVNSMSEIIADVNQSTSFKVYFSEGIFNLENSLIKDYCKQKKCCVVISETVNKLFRNEIEGYFSSHITNFKIIVIKTTELNKNMDNVLEICSKGKEFGLDRKSLFVAIGGGILLDIVGFAASMFKRRLDYLRIPTTLLGQVDAGVGIKTGVNFAGTKNYIGSFHPAIATFNDINLLKTLPEDQFLCGIGEIIKMAIICDQYLFDLVKKNHVELLEGKYQNNLFVSNKINYISVQQMLDHLNGNFYEDNLERLVDFGHTFSPFIEEYSNYRINHGKAVVMDIAISTEISYLMGRINETDRNNILSTLLSIGYEIFNAETFIPELMYKSLDIVIQHRGNDLNLVIPLSIGEASFVKKPEQLPLQLLASAMNNLQIYQSAFNAKRSIEV